MLILEIPYEPENATWRVEGLIDGDVEFNSRMTALTFAMGAAQQYVTASDAAHIHLQGADGTWRMFDAAMLPLPDNLKPGTEN